MAFAVPPLRDSFWGHYDLTASSTPPDAGNEREEKLYSVLVGRVSFGLVSRADVPTTNLLSLYIQYNHTHCDNSTHTHSQNFPSGCFLYRKFLNKDLLDFLHNLYIKIYAISNWSTGETFYVLSVYFRINLPLFSW